MLGGALMAQGRLAEAEPLLASGYEGRKAREATIPPEAKGGLPESAERLVRLYEASGETGRAAAWRVKPGLVQPGLPTNSFARP